MLKQASALALAAAWSFACAPAMAAQAVQPERERSAQIERLDVAYVIQADGSFTETREQAIKVLKPEALEYVKDASIGYSTSIQKADVLEAYTLKADGRRLPVPKSNYQVQTNGGHAEGGPVFSDRTSMTVVFPELAVGDTVVFKYRLTGSQPMFDRQFSEVETFSLENYYGQVDVRFDAPAQLPVRTEAWKMEQVRDEVVGERRLSHWRFQNRQPLMPDETGAMFRFEDQPGLVYSTFASYGDIAQVYGARASAKAAVTPRIRKLADEIAGTRKQPREVAKALYEWVSTNITYAGNCIGLGAVVPHDTDFILDNKMGDCKDHATLLQALLTAKDIPATQALINANDLFLLPRTPAVSMVNHVINYLPEWDLYVDATAKGIPFGMLPMQDMGKPVFRVDGYRDGTTTPAMVPGSSRQTVKTKFRFSADGSIAGESEIELQGMYAVGVRSALRGTTQDQASQMMKRYFQQLGSDGTASMRMDDPMPLEDRYRYQVTFSVGQAMPVPGAVAVNPLFQTTAPVMRFASQANMQVDETRPVVCTSGSSQEEYEIEFASPLQLAAIPPDVDMKGSAFSYRASYKRDGNTLRVTRVLEDLTPGPLCEPKYNQDYKDFMRKVLANLRAQVVYQ